MKGFEMQEQDNRQDLKLWTNNEIEAYLHGCLDTLHLSTLLSDFRMELMIEDQTERYETIERAVYELFRLYKRLPVTNHTMLAWYLESEIYGITEVARLANPTETQPV